MTKAPPPPAAPIPGDTGAGSNVLDNALARVRALDPALAQTLTREVDALRDSRKFGLVFEKHLPESVHLPNHPIKRGVKVAARLPAKGCEDQIWTVTRVSKSLAGQRTATLNDGTEITVDSLVAIRDFGEPVYPGLTSRRRIANGSDDAPWHTVTNGENYHALQALRYTHRAAVDLIYIDPPYNTGNRTWIYNDRFVAEQDRDKHSKWLSFMERRLLVARELLKETGVIIVAIGDDEHHRLRMLMDQVFGAQNFISDVVWQGGRKNDSRFVSNGADYMLVYAKDESPLKDSVNRWSESRPGVDEILAAGVDAWKSATNGTSLERATTAEAALKAWQRALPKDHPARAKGLSDFNKIDERGAVYRLKDISWPGGDGPRYDVLHPVTKQPVKVPGRGWIFSSQKRMQEEIDAGRVVFGKDHNAYINRKSYLHEADSMGPESVFVQKRTGASQRLEAILGDKRFPFPKDHEVLMRWIRLAAPKDAVVLDFFGGSGTTSEAVLRLNAEDGGTRQSILVTNNEVSAKDSKALAKDGHAPGDDEWEARGVCRHVAEPRIATVVTGTREDGSIYSNGIKANVEFFELTYLDPDQVTRAREFKAVAPLLWMKAGATGERIATEPDEGWMVTPAYCVLFDIDASEPFIQALAAIEQPPPFAFIVTDSPSDYAAVAADLPRTTRPHRLYESYMRNFQINVEASL